MSDQTLLTIDSVDRTSSVMLGSTSIQATLGATSTMRVTLVDLSNQLTIEAGETIELSDAGATIFSGTVDRVTEEFPSQDPLNTAKLIKLKCVDWCQLATRRLVTTYYAADVAGTIVKDLVSKYLGNDSITVVGVEDGLTVGPLVFNYKTLSSCLDRIAKIVGFYWFIDYDKDMVFAPRNTAVAPYTLVDGTRTDAKLTVERGRKNYRNVQVILGGDDLFEEKARTFKGDGETSTFILDYPCGAKPTVSLDGVSKTVGLRGEDAEDDEDGFDWFWRKGDNTISQNSTDAAPTSSEILRVEYQPLMPLTLMLRDQPAIDDRVTVEGGSGIYESVKTERQIEDENVALSIGEAWLRRHARINTEISVTTYNTGYRPGQLQTVELVNESLGDDFLITSVSIKERGLGNFVTRYKAVDNELQGGWPEYFKLLAAAGSEQATESTNIVNPIAQVGSNAGVSHTESTATGDNQGDIDTDPYTNGMIGNDCWIGYGYTDEGSEYASGAVIGDSPS